MKWKVTILVSVIVAGLLIYEIGSGSNPAMSHGAGAPAGYAGDPAGGNKTCNTTACHTGGPTPPSIPGMISSNVPTAGYTPGTTYTITATVAYPNHTKYGFELSPQSAAGAILGTLINTSTETQLVGSGGYVTHTSTGTSSPGGFHTWSVNWTAPAAGSGDVTFYGAFNITNSSNNAQGDTIVKSTLLIPENTSTAGINNSQGKELSVSVFPNPVSEVLNVSFATMNEQELTIKLIDVQGRLVDVLFQGKSTGTCSKTFNISGKYKAGTYLISVKTNESVEMKTIVIQ